MFNYTEGAPAAFKAEIWQVIIELKSNSGLNSDIQFDYGYMDGENFMKVGKKKRHLRQDRTLAMINIIRNSASPAAAKQDLEDHLVLELIKEPDVPDVPDVLPEEEP